LLILLLLASLGGGGYEFYLQQQAQVDYLQKRQEYAPQIAQMTAENKQLHEDNDRTTREVSGMQNQ
jgi:cell division protein FtsB